MAKRGGAGKSSGSNGFLFLGSTTPLFAMKLDDGELDPELREISLSSERATLSVSQQVNQALRQRIAQLTSVIGKLERTLTSTESEMNKVHSYNVQIRELLFKAQHAESVSV